MLIYFIAFVNYVSYVIIAVMQIVSFAVIKLCLIAVFGFILYKKNIVDRRVLDFLTFLVINLAIPFFFFSHLIDNADLVLRQSVLAFLSLSVIIFFAGYGLGILSSFKKGSIKREFISIVSFQNSGYLPMNIALFLFTPAVREAFLVYVILYLLGYNILIWSVGSFLIFREKGEKLSKQSLFTPPILATIIALVFLYSGLYKFVPELILCPVRMIGNISFVFSMIILGCWLAMIDRKGILAKIPVITVASLLKLVIMPLIFFVILRQLKVFSILGLFILMQAAMPSATSLPIVVSLRKGGNAEFISQGVFFSHLLSIFTVPLWLGLFLDISGVKL